MLRKAVFLILAFVILSACCFTRPQNIKDCNIVFIRCQKNCSVFSNHEAAEECLEICHEQYTYCKYHK